ncbi:MAG: heme-binding protein [Phycisphaerales bacterium]|jgi:glc operon protein GlcG
MKRFDLKFVCALSAAVLATASIASARREATVQPVDAPAPAAGSPQARPSVAIKHTLTLEGANRVIAAAIAKATERHAGGAIAVVDDGGHLIALQRLDDTFAAGSEVSTGKARTAALFKKPTKAFEDSINGGRYALGSVREMTPLQGGIPIMHDGFVIGGVGVSGAHSQVEDEEIAIAGAAAISRDPVTPAK